MEIEAALALSLILLGWLFSLCIAFIIGQARVPQNEAEIYRMLEIMKAKNELKTAKRAYTNKIKEIVESASKPDK